MVRRSGILHIGAEQEPCVIVNISAGGDFEQSYLRNSLCRLVEETVAAGVIVVCAVGNAGLAPGHPVLPPASSIIARSSTIASVRR